MRSRIPARALMAVAHSVLVIAYDILKDTWPDTDEAG